MATVLALAGVLGPGCSADPTDHRMTSCGESGVICTIAGTGTSGLDFEERAPLETQLYLPIDVTIGPHDGRPYVVDFNNHRIAVVEPDAVRRLIGSGTVGSAEDGPARETSLNHPTHLTFSPEGDIVLSTWHVGKVITYDFDTDLVSVLCGTGEEGFNGDGLPGLETDFSWPSSTVYSLGGSQLFVSDQKNQRVRALEDGVMTTILGTGLPGYAGDGGPALEALISCPVGNSAQPGCKMAVGPGGDLFLADTNNHVIRQVAPPLDGSGVISTVAGTGTAGLGGEGVGTEMALNGPVDVAIDEEGIVFIADTFNHCVRRLDQTGHLSTLAGVCGENGYAGDGGPANESFLDRPYGVALDRDGNVYIADSFNDVVRVVYH